MARINPHLPQFTKHRKGKRQFKRKQNHWADKITEARLLAKAEADAKEAKVKARLDRKLENENKRNLKATKPVVKRVVLEEFDEEFSKL